MKSANNGQQGQSLVEAVLGLALIGTFLIFLGATVYFAFSRIWLSHRLNEAVLCAAEGTHSSTCSHRLTEQAQRTLPLGRLQYVRIYGRERWWRGELVWKWKHSWNIKIKQTLHLDRIAKPVPASSSW